MATPMQMLLPDPGTMIAAVSAVLQAIQTWISYRDKSRAATGFDTAFTRAKSDPAIAEEADRLRNLVPSDILGTMTRRVDDCWKKFRPVIEPGSPYLPDEVDESVTQVKACICRELRRIHRLNGVIPPGKLEEYWNAYCTA